MDIKVIQIWKATVSNYDFKQFLLCIFFKRNHATAVAVVTFSCTVYTETVSFLIFQEIFRKVSVFRELCTWLGSNVWA
jgi:hypothetical protein